MRAQTEHAAGEIAGGAVRRAASGNSSAASLKRCPGWHVAEHVGQEPHELPATLQYFHASTYKPDGLNHKCKGCHGDYKRYVSAIEAQQRAAIRAGLSHGL